MATHAPNAINPKLAMRSTAEPKRDANRAPAPHSARAMTSVETV